ncbi:MAG: hypothetical protein O3A63_20255 [Proteobacteria bacterium]|nr:hypothetical protein [Pseudomonadota bacterium]
MQVIQKLILCTLLFTPGFSAANLEGVGSVTFETSATGEAQAHFLRGVATLHSFGWQQAAQAFQAAQQADPGFAMAYWGESLCYNHPLITEWDLKTPQSVLMKLGSTREARLAAAPTDRERGYIDAVDALFFGEGDYPARRSAYMHKMADLYTRYPDDDEVAAFYALSLMSAAGPAGGDSMRLNIKAGAIAIELFYRHPDHPGAAHYTIHAFDDPIHAPLALPAARKFASIAPAVSHARHMPTHIFIQQGMWREVSDNNQSAYDAAVALWTPGSFTGDMAHALDWGQYGDLQLGDFARAQMWIDKAKTMAEQNPKQANLAEAPGNLQARYVVEAAAWEVTEIQENSTATQIFASGASAVHLGQTAQVEKAIASLKVKASAEVKDTSYYSRTITPVKIMHQELMGLLALKKGQTEDALTHLDTAVDLAESMRPPNGAANPIKPPHELKGEVLVSLGRYQDAMPVLEKSLQRTPRRPLSLLALARAHAGLGNSAQAQRYYRELLDAREQRDLPDTREARVYLQARG